MAKGYSEMGTGHGNAYRQQQRAQQSEDGAMTVPNGTTAMTPDSTTTETAQ